MEWTNRIAGCFGDVDLIFAGHPNDEERAFQLLTELRNEGIRWSEVETEINNWLSKKGAGEEHIKRELSSVKKYFEPWIQD